jgi:PAS domain-containing protein
MLIHPSHQPAARQAIRAVVALFVLLLLVMALPMLPGLQGVSHYLPLHMALETLAIVVAALTFGMAWSVRREQLPLNALLLGCAFLGVGLLDFSHMLSYSGMPDFITPNTSDKAIHYWLSARLLSALALLAVAWLPWGSTATRSQATLMTAAVLVLVAALHGLFFLAPHLLPVTFVPGGGLTAFKIAFEYTLMALYLAAAARLLWHMRRQRSFNASGLFAAACVMAASFSLPVTPASPTSTTSRATLQSAGLRLPRGFVKRATAIHLAAQLARQRGRWCPARPLLELDDDGRYIDARAGHAGALVAPTVSLLGKTLQEALPAEAARISLAALDEARQTGFSRGRVVALEVPDGQRWFELSVARMAPQPGQGPRYVVISRDITQRLQSEGHAQASQAVAQNPTHRHHRPARPH